MVVGGLLIAALPLVDEAEVAQRDGFAITVADLAGQGQGLLEMVGSLLIATLPQVDGAEAAKCMGFG
jgi:hypothetical protein